MNSRTEEWQEKETSERKKGDTKKKKRRWEELEEKTKNERRRVRRVAFGKEVLIWASSKRVIKTSLEVR